MMIQSKFSAKKSQCFKVAQLLDSTYLLPLLCNSYYTRITQLPKPKKPPTNLIIDGFKKLVELHELRRFQTRLIHPSIVHAS
jgi:hypothetical protein